MPDVVLLVGAPNAGKSTVFNALTGGHAKVGNWHGVTVGALEKRGMLGGEEVLLVDLPGIYSLESMSMEEKFTADYLTAHPDARVLFVAECSALERTLPLLFSLGDRGMRAALLLTKGRTFRRHGGKVDVQTLSRLLGIPVFERVQRRGEPVGFSLPRRADISGAYTPMRSGLSRADRLLLNGFFGLPLFFAFLGLSFFLTFARGMPGDLMKTAVDRLFSETLAGLAEGIPLPVLRSFVQDGLLASLGSVLSILPQIVLLYFFLTLFEESGLLSRLAFLTDGLFARVGLNGRAVFSLLMGFGCTAAAILTTRGWDDKRIQRRVILSLPYISCSAKLPVYLTLAAAFFGNPFLAVLLLYALGAGLTLIVAYLLKEETPPFLMELAPLQIPNPVFVAKTLLFQAKQFIIKVATVVLAFFLLSWVLSSFTFTFRPCGAEESMLAHLCGGLGFLFAPAGMNDWRIAYAALSGLVAKENVAGAIGMFFGEFPYSAASAFSFAVFILTCSPCVSAITATARELGAARALLYALLQTGSALVLSYLTYFALKGGWIVLFCAAALLAALAIIGKNREKIHRHRKHDPRGLHRQHLRAGFLRIRKAAQSPRDQGKRGESLGGPSPAGGG